MKPGIFLDLNGTLVLPVQARSPGEYQPIPGAFAAIRRLNESGFICPVITVQSRIAGGIYSEDDFHAWFERFRHAAAAEGARIAGLYLCPHRFHSGCACCKPNTALYEQAAQDLDIDRAQSFVVGDTVDDLEAARRLGVKAGLVLTGWGHRAVERWSYPPHIVGGDVSDVADQIIGSGTTRDRGRRGTGAGVMSVRRTAAQNPE